MAAMAITQNVFLFKKIEISWIYGEINFKSMLKQTNFSFKMQLTNLSFQEVKMSNV
jgi:hypothetical protein